MNTKNNIYSLIDDNGNVTQIKKQSKKKYKYYIDPELSSNLIEQPCYIGISNTESGDCSYGIALGFGDRTVIIAKY